MFKIDMYDGEYDPARNSVVWWWSDTAARYFGWIRNPKGVVVGDFSADSLQEAEHNLGLKLGGRMSKEKSNKAESVAAAYAIFLEKKSVYFAEKTEEAWKDYTEAYYAWIDAVCDDISAEHNQRVLARENGGAVKKVKNNG